MAHIQPEFEGTTLQKWELDHGIARVVRGGCEYVLLTRPLAAFDAQCAREDAEHRRRWQDRERIDSLAAGEEAAHA